MIEPSNHTATVPLSEEDFKALLDHANGGVAIIDAKSMRLLYQNAGAGVLLRQAAPADGSCLPYLRNGHHEGGRPYAEEEYPLARALRGEAVRQEALLYRHENGEFCLFQINAIPLRDADGAVSRVFIYFLDISKRRKAELALKASEQRLELALSAAKIGLWEVDVQTGAVQADQRVFAALGLQPDDLDASFNAWLTLLHPEDKKMALDRWYEHLEGKTAVYDVDYRIRTKFGDWIWVAARGQVVERDADSRPVRVAGTLLDINDLKQAELSLRESEELFRCTLEHAAIGLATLLPSGGWVGINPKLGDILGYSIDELRQIGHLRNLIHPDDVAGFDRQLGQLLSDGDSSFTLEQRYRRKDGRTIWASLTASVIRQDDGQVKWIIYALEDTTARKEAEQHLHKTQVQLHMATRIARLGFWEWEPATGYCYFSSEWKAQLGYRSDELDSRYEEWETRVHPDDSARVVGQLFAYVEAPSGDFEQEFRLQHKNGSYRWIVTRGVPLFNAAGKVDKMVGIHLDVTDQKRAEESIRQQAQHDGLTGLPNRGLLHEFAEQVLAAARRSGAPLAVMFIDLDRFKSVNDNHGHQAGDAVLREVANRLNQLRRAEDVVGRLGGDEFVTILPDIHNKEGAATVAAKALEVLRQPYLVDGLELPLSPSIGISLFPEDGDNIDALLKRADAAMYEVKGSGCNDFRFAHAGYNTGAPTQARYRSLELRLRAALAKQEFELHYQPMMDTLTGAVIGVEALVRWQRNGRSGNQPEPSVFIPVAEACGLILPLGKWILQQACRQHGAWFAEGLPPIPIAINISELQLEHGEFRHSIERAVAETGIDPAFLEIEIKESTALNNFERTCNALNALKDIGLRIALDGCSTDYLNLTQLSRLPLDRLKFQSSLVRHLSRDKAGMAIAGATIAFGRALGADVVAEGIETEQELQVLREYDCRQAQGFHLGRPMPAQYFAEWYRQHSLH